MLTDQQDPLADKPKGPCTVCDHRWVTVAKDANDLYLGPNPNDLAYADRVAKTEVYPCPDCAPELFLQATNGCFNRDHRPCDRCEYRRSHRSYL